VASFTAKPTLDLTAGHEVLDKDLAAALAYYDVGEPEALGWRRQGPRCLLIPISGIHDGAADEFLLKLEFKTGREWPPSAQFIDPESLIYRGLEDQHHLPQIRSSEVNVHASYACQHVAVPIQLICCSATYEYYDVLHGGEDGVLWKENYSFLVTVSAIKRAMGSHYFGRFPRHDTR
jgi:hypothetical protein